MRTNEHGQPVGEEVRGWQPVPRPEVERLRGRWCTVERLDQGHVEELFCEIGGPEHARLWTYLADGPHLSVEDLHAHVTGRLGGPAVQVAIRDASGLACGLAALMRIDERNGVVEVGSIVLGPRLQRTRAATEAMSLLARHVFEHGYRRYEWKCDHLNVPSRRAAERLGFRYEGTFRRHLVTKGRSRDTAWFAMTLDEWPRIRAAHEAWLDPANFDDGVQRVRLGDLLDRIVDPAADGASG